MTFLNVPPSLDWPAQFCAFSAAACWVLSIVTGNVSQVDRVWTFLPPIYTAYYAFLPLLPNEQSFFLVPYTPKSLGWERATHYSPRALLMFGLVCVWMCRLTYNTYRRGLFNLRDEDYRWAVLRSQVPAALFQVINLTFIAITQNILLLLLGLPARTAALQDQKPLSPSDYALAALALFVITAECTADNQQYAYHGYKHAFLAKEKGDKDVKPYNPNDHWIGSRLNWTPDDAKRGFVTRGLWAYARHPNFFFEQAFWWIITLFPLISPSAPHLPSADDFPPLQTVLTSLGHADLRKPMLNHFITLLSPTFFHLLPALSLSALFFSSTLFTEAISKKKYPKAYSAYQKRVGMFALGKTVLKLLKLQLFATEKERKELDRLIWGPVEEHDKSE